ncbi:MAG: restriction endonuclease subunit S [Paludibacteraceae bacterium]|nr:restriction endonuclease subunit S [Paludibacteraceae bacterium]
MHKSHYENVPFEIPKNWVWCKLDDLAFYKKGPFGSSLTKSMFIPDNEIAYKVYEQKNAIQKDSSLGHYFISSEKFQELKGFEVLPNDIIVSCAGTIGETYIMPSDIRSGIINQALMIIRLHNIDITPFYLLYFDFILKNEAGKDGKGTAIKNIPPFDILKNYWIPLPPLAEQDRIIKEVDLWQCLIDSIDGNIEDIFKLSKKTKSKILDLAISGKLVPQDPNDESATELLKRINPDFQPCDNSHYENLPQGWVNLTLGDVCNFERGVTFPSSAKSTIKQSATIACIRTANVQEELDLTDLWYIGAEYIKGNPNKLVRKNDIIMSSANSRELVGKVSYVYDLSEDMTFGGFVLNIRAKECILPFYLFLILRALYLNGTYLTIATQTTNIANLNTKILSGIEVMIPSLAEQERIMKAVTQIFANIDAITAELS